MGDFILTLLHSATNAHILHFKTKSYAQHMALATFYEEMPDLVDELVEAIQGLTGELIEFPADYYTPASTALEEMQDLKEYIKQGRIQLPSESEIQNLVDEIAALVNTTLYKIKFLG
jgi:DNA-binding ferritin-like protein